jgi:hypothetical protein
MFTLKLTAILEEGIRCMAETFYCVGLVSNTRFFAHQKCIVGYTKWKFNIKLIILTYSNSYIFQAVAARLVGVADTMGEVALKITNLN